jgi:hypothetical protein
MRFGIDLTTNHTLEEVGKQFDVTRERIRQIEAKALHKLRRPGRSGRLRSFPVEDWVQHQIDLKNGTQVRNNGYRSLFAPSPGGHA